VREREKNRERESEREIETGREGDGERERERERVITVLVEQWYFADSGIRRITIQYFAARVVSQSCCQSSLGTLYYSYSCSLLFPSYAAPEIPM
jgi:hypothetical protein